MSWPGGVACVLVAAWLIWEYQRLRRSADSNKLFCAELFGTATWTGVWLLEVQRAQQSNLRTEVLKATEAGGSPSQLAQALMASGKPRVLAHLPGPMELSKQQALDWIEQLGPRLAKMQLPDHFTGSNEQIFALAYASHRRPPAHQSLAQILEYLVDSFGGSLVCCAKSSARWPSFVRFVRFGLGVALFALLFEAFTAALTPYPAPPPTVHRVQPAEAPKPEVSKPESVSQPAAETAKATPAAPVTVAAEPAKSATAPEPEAAPAAPKRDKPRPNVKKEPSVATTGKPKAAAGASQSAPNAQPANGQRSGDAKTNGKGGPHE